MLVTTVAVRGGESVNGDGSEDAEEHVHIKRLTKSACNSINSVMRTQASGAEKGEHTR